MVKELKKEEVKTLLKRREEISIEINKLQEEYTALGNILTYYLNNEKDRKKLEEYEDGRK